jgi:uncharacterized protein YbjQ (UPF0145 family)
MELMVLLLSPLMLLGAWATGALLERGHFKKLMLLESGSRDILAITVEDIPADWQVESSNLVVGNVVISQDYFKRVVAGINGIFGGRIGVFEPLLERARREALQRMKAQAAAAGHDTVINVRLETTVLANGRRDGKGTAGVEILAFGTAITRRS